jgi:pSer/pThr/pTyr-binding forkhead associated (FHA) protein
MKLLFPNGEHEPVELREGISLVGSVSDAQVMLAAPSIAARHCELHMRGETGSVVPLDAAAATVLNGRQISGETPIKPGDLLLFGKVGCRVVAIEKTAPQPIRKAPAPSGDDDGRTRVRMALPKYLLRGVSGPTFGKTYAMVGTLIVGRSTDCGISIASDEISRHHAKLQVVPDGVMVEDMGSANGTFVNNQRVHAGTLLKAGDELRVDTVRFMLMSPTMDVNHPAVAAARGETPAAPAPAPQASGGSSTMWIIAGAVVLGLIVLGVLRYLGKI